MNKLIVVCVTLACVLCFVGGVTIECIFERKTFMESQCSKRCESDSDCNSEEKCVCDSVCGRSCENTHLQIEPRQDNVTYCRPPPEIKRAAHTGRPDRVTFNMGNTVTYMCLPGFIANEQNPQHAMCLGGQWAMPSITCRTIHCKRLRRPLHSKMTESDNFYGSVVRIVCDIGYNLVGSAERTCQANGTWSGEESACEEITCSPIEPIPNGYAEGNLTTLGSVYHYRCYTRTTLLGTHSSTRCMDNGQWSHPPALCLGQCELKMINGDFVGASEGDWIDHGSRIEVKCRDGYTLPRTREIVCENGTWSVEPKCVPASCSEPPKIQNGYSFFTHLNHEGTAKYFCLPGYRLVGYNQFLNCDLGKWKGLQPVCEKNSDERICIFERSDVNDRTCSKRCMSDDYCDPTELCVCDGMCDRVCVNSTLECEEELEDFANGSVTFIPENRFEALANYTCDEGFILKGFPIRICQGDGRWMNVQPTCEHVASWFENHHDCGYPPIALLAAHDAPPNQTQFKPDTQVIYRCVPGFYQPDSNFSQSTCSGRGSWSEPAIMCLGVYCPYLEPPLHGHMVGSNAGYGSITRFYCDPGYTLVGSAERTCQANNTWNGQQATCEETICDPPGPFYNGYLEGQSTEIGSLYFYRCNKYTTFSGPELATSCMQNGQWSQPNSFCFGHCEVPVITNATTREKQGDLTIHGYIIKPKCLRDLVLNDSRAMTCQNGTWAVIPQCVPVPCDEPPLIDNGYRVFHNLNHMSVAEYFCESEYTPLQYHGSLTCKYGKWKGNTPSCEKRGEARTCDHTFTDTVNRSCSMSCESDLDCANTSRKCLCDGDCGWSCVNPSLRCLKQHENITNGAVTVTIYNRYETVANYSCDANYTLVGLRSRPCFGGEIWLGDSPRCESKDNESVSAHECSYPPEFNYAVHSASPSDPKFSIESVVQYTCLPGYSEGTGSNSIFVCRGEESWYGETVKCKATNCIELYAPSNGIIIGSKTSFGSVIRFACNVGYNLSGSAERVCGHGGMWSGNRTKCKAIDCGTPVQLYNGHLDGNLTTVGSVYYYRCLSRTVFIGPDVATHCLENGQWSHPPPVCLAQCQVPNIQYATYDNIDSGDWVNDGFIVNLACHSNRTLTDQRVMTCKNGTWSNIPRCVTEFCKEHPPETANGYSVYTDLGEGSVATYSCLARYAVTNNERNMTCHHGKWEGNIPVCLKSDDQKICDYKRSPNLNRTCYNSCDTDTDCVKGETCMCDGECGRSCVSLSRKCLRHPAKFQNGQISVSLDKSQTKDDSLPFEATVNYNCDDGFTLVGLRVRVCQGDGSWSGDAPTCEPTNPKPIDRSNDCRIPPHIQHSWHTEPHTKTRYSFKTTLTYSCIPGFTIQKESRRSASCLKDGGWSIPRSTCIIVHCGQLQTSLNGDRIGSNTSYGSVARFTCNIGYQLVGSAERTCQANGTWSGEDASCTDITCDPPEPFYNGYMESSGTTIGSLNIYKCTPGTTPHSSKMASMCMENGHWSNPPPQCLNQCQIPSISNATFTTVNVGDWKDDGSTIEPKCDPGLTLSVTRPITCSNGTWTATPSCVPDLCPCPDKQENGLINILGSDGHFRTLDCSSDIITLGTKLQFKCNRGYLLSGNATKTCEDDWTWNPREFPRCDVK